MASGDFLYSDPRDFFILVPWVSGGCYVSTYNGFEYYNDDGQSGSYCASGDYCQSGYIFFNQLNIGFTGVGTGAFIDSTGSFCCTVFSDGTGGYFWKNIYYYATVLSCSGHIIDILNQSFNNGYLCLVSNGSGSCFEINTYCESDSLFFSCSGLNFKSDGIGGYFFEETVNRNLYNVSIDWDFSKRTKEIYNFNQRDACGDVICISIQNNSNIFYEINTISDTTICICEANIQKSLFIEDSCVPFLYFRNVGNAILNIDLDSGIFCRDFFKKCQIYNKTNYCDSSIFLCANDSIFLSFNVSNSGTEYYSNICYPFGFFYEFKNVESVNPYGLYPVCCGIDPISCCFIPTFIYSELCDLPIENHCVISTGYSYNYRKLLSFSENLLVDNSNLEISLIKNTGSGINEFININTNFDIISSYGINHHKAKICTNEILILDNGCQNLIAFDSCFEKEINLNHQIKVVYDVDFKFSKTYNLTYLDTCCSGANYDFQIIIDSSTGLQSITKNCLYAMGNIIELNNSDFAYVNIFNCNGTVIKDIWTSPIQRNNLYLPTHSDFEYCCCFLLNKSNYKDTKVTSGFWGSNSGTLPVDSGFCNYITLINTGDAEYQQYKSLNYCINLCTCESRASSSDIQNKNLFEASDAFLLTYCSTECCYFYCDLEFRYTPIDSVLYKNTFYKMPGYMMNVDFYLSGTFETICFPVNALNFDKLKIITTFDVFDASQKSELSINYFGFNFALSCECSNYVNYKFPIIQCSNLSGYEYPDISISNNVKHQTQSNITFEVNPLKCFNSDFYYGLNNFLLFVNSKLHGGIALDFLNCGTKQMCDYEYNSNCYSFLMMDLLCENFCCFSGSTISGAWNKILEYVSFQDNFELIPYKNNTGNGYNYVFPIVEKICYNDTYTGNGGTISVNRELSGILNYISTGFNYDGLSTDQILLTGATGNVTGTGIMKTSGASFFSSYNFNSINLTDGDLTGTIKSRNITTSKKYNFTGVQPLCIVSNYPLSDISLPIVCTNLQEYSCNINENETSGMYYYLYSINNPQNKPVKITAPDLTFITEMCWNNQTVNSNPNSSNTAQIVNNLARINLDINNFIYDNPYFINTGSIKSLCLNLLGGL